MDSTHTLIFDASFFPRINGPIVYYIVACLLQFILNCGKIESFTF